MAIYSVTFVLYFVAIISVFYIGYLIGRVQKLQYCDHIGLHPRSLTNSITPQYVTEIIEPPAVIRCPPDMTLSTEQSSSSTDQLVSIPKVTKLADITCDFQSVTPVYLHKRKGITQDLLFNYVNHAAQPTKGDVIITHHRQVKAYSGEGTVLGGDNDPFNHCNQVYLTRTGSRESPKPKCVAVMRIGNANNTSPFHISHRMGSVAQYIDQYQRDYSKNYRDEEILLVPLLRKRQEAIDQIRGVLGDPVVSVDPVTGVETRKTAVVMVANEGVIDLVMNLLCSCRAANIDTSNYVIYVGSESDVKVINAMGVHAIYNPSLGSMPKTAAFNYGDGTFSRMMWLKVSAVYVANAAGYNVLFQDADLVWFQDPIPYLQTIYGEDTDILFMDDGGRTPRFTPLYVNSGFYWMKYNPRTVYLMEKMLKSVSEISTTHSHQATLIRHIVESHEIVGLEIKMVDQKLFPSGYMYHHEKKYIQNLKDYKIYPYVFHMCWTDNRDQKIDYFKTIGMWYLPNATFINNMNPRLRQKNDNICAKATSMMSWLDAIGAKDYSDSLLSKCCQTASYFHNKPK